MARGIITTITIVITAEMPQTSREARESGPLFDAFVIPGSMLVSPVNDVSKCHIRNQNVAKSGNAAAVVP